VSGDLHTPVALTLREITPGTHWMGCWVGPISDFDDEKGKFLILLGLELVL
jgi:hypothetical protein